MQDAVYLHGGCIDARHEGDKRRATQLVRRRLINKISKKGLMCVRWDAWDELLGRDGRGGRKITTSGYQSIALVAGEARNAMVAGQIDIDTKMAGYIKQTTVFA